MYKDKEIKFRQVDETHIDIILTYEDLGGDKNPGFQKKEKKIGHIFVGDYTNAIQVCGFSEAFDYWGCGVFSKPKYIEKSGEKYSSHRKMPVYHPNNERWMEQTRDIQLFFDAETVEKHVTDLDDCMRCYNSPCGCHVPRKTNVLGDMGTGEGDNGKGSPFIAKRREDIADLEHREERKKRRIESAERSKKFDEELKAMKDAKAEPKIEYVDYPKLITFDKLEEELRLNKHYERYQEEEFNSRFRSTKYPGFSINVYLKEKKAELRIDFEEKNGSDVFMTHHESLPPLHMLEKEYLDHLKEEENKDKEAKFLLVALEDELKKGKTK